MKYVRGRVFDLLIIGGARDREKYPGGSVHRPEVVLLYREIQKWSGWTVQHWRDRRPQLTAADALYEQGFYRHTVMGGPHDSVPRERRFPHELFALFEEMQNTKEDAVPPYRVLRCLQILDVRLCVQYDIADLFFTLWNLLIQQMPESHLVDKLKDLFIIQLKDSVTCRKCYQQRSTDSDLLTISVPVSASRHHAKLPLEYALRKFFKTKELNGDHKRFCPKCGENTPSLKGMQLLSLPRTLTIHLKRLRHQKSTQIQKINRAVSFPPFLDLSDVLDADHLPDEDSAQSHYTYRLFAVVAHSGTASSGYYCAYINSSKDNKWYCFNDSSVCKVSWDDVKCTYGNTTFSWGVTACLLMYVKADLE
ncbi:ubl carboxyl-terminal hydrolase 18 isoform 1-T1 [Discoglossus pictus]